MRVDASNIKPVAPTITARDLGRQFWLDAYGKEVQSAATYSYMWMADQAGHIGLGILLHFAFTALVGHGAPEIGLGAWFRHPWQSELVGFLATVCIVSAWELSAYGADVKRAQGSLFPLQTRLLHHNAVAAAAYMSLGGGVGWALHLSWHYSLPSIALITIIIVITAKPWVREKIIWQKAALPYLARLADVRPDMPVAVANALWSLICAPPPPAGPARAIVMAGAVGSGRTLVSCSIGTEFAFRRASVRYLPFGHLLEMAGTGDFEVKPPLPGPSNIGYWPWSQAQVLIIDDIGPLVSNMHPATASDDHTLGLRQVLEERLTDVRTALACRHTVWILGQCGSGSYAELEASAKVIGKFLGLADVLAVPLAAQPTQPSVQDIDVPDAPVAAVGYSAHIR